MTAETEASQPFTLKRIVLTVITLLVALVMGQALLSSLKEPQVASRLQLYQTDLLLQASAWEAAPLPADQRSLLREGLLGKNPLKTATEQYQQVRASAVEGVNQAESAVEDSALSVQEGKPLPRRLQAALAQQRLLVDQIDLRLGLLQAQQGDGEAALKRWRQVFDSETAPPAMLQTADALIQLWDDNQVEEDWRTLLDQTLEGWFRYRALEKYYQVSQQPEAVVALLAQEQVQAQKQLVKLVLVGTVPAVGALIGLGLLIWLLIQRFTQGEQALLRLPNSLRWEIPWDGETIWQVLVVGFFFVGQILLPILLSSLGLNGASLSSRGRAFYSMAYYLLMATGGIAVLVWSIRPFRPLPKDLFKLKLRGNGWKWGIGGYFVALPLMLAVALLNQQLWDGQGGSNPLLQTVLEEQDPVALILFLVTASIAAPVFEELLFRGFLLPSLTKYLPVGGAIGVSALVFATAHLSFSEILPLAVLGIVLGFVYTRSRNLLAPMLLHSAWNSATMIGLFLLGS